MLRSHKLWFVWFVAGEATKEYRAIVPREQDLGDPLQTSLGIVLAVVAVPLMLTRIQVDCIVYRSQGEINA